MASKRIDELTTRTVVNTDLLPPTPTGGPSGSATVAAVVAAGLSQPNSASAGAGASLTIKAADGVTSGAGGNITITPGAQATTGGPGKVVIDTLTVGRGGGGIASNTAIGFNALSGNTTGFYNVAIGYGANQYGQSSYNNVIIGPFAGGGLNGNQNTLIGHSAGNSINSGSNNICLGADAARAITSGSENICIGGNASSLNTSLGSGLNGTKTIYIGNQTRCAVTTETNSIIIGHYAISEGSNSVVIGTSSTVQQHFYATQYIKTEGSLAYAGNTVTISVNQNNYVLTGSAFQRFYCTSASNITGIAPPTSGAHVDGRMIRIVNVGTAVLTLKHNSTSSSAANRMFCASGADYALAANTWAELVYDSTDNGSGAAGWRVYQ